jgi:hypothetical protein
VHLLVSSVRVCSTDHSADAPKAVDSQPEEKHSSFVGGGERGTERNTKTATGQWARIPPAWESPSPTQGLTFLSYLGGWKVLGRLLASVNLAPRFAALVTGGRLLLCDLAPEDMDFLGFPSNADMMGSATSKP